MGFPITAAEYAAYLTLAARKIEAEKEYISALDAATGDGDHWANLNTGFERLVREREELAALPLSACFQRIGMLMMNSIGGSSGILYGGAYMAAARTLRGKEVIDREALGQVLQAMVEDMCTRGGSKPGYKTMIDALYPAAETYRQLAERGAEDAELFSAVKRAALEGAEATKEMEAVRGRAYYQPNKGVGHLDPGAVTMSYQIEILMDFIARKA